jgi:hypothetical protein
MAGKYSNIPAMAIPDARYRIEKNGAHPGILRNQVAVSVSTAKAQRITDDKSGFRSIDCNELQINIFFHQLPNEFIYLKGFFDKYCRILRHEDKEPGIKELQAVYRSDIEGYS